MARPAWQGSTRRSSLPWGWYTRIRPRIFARDRERCQWIREDTGMKCLEHGNQVDHKVPHHLGGTDHDDNLWTLCTYHHERKSSSEGGTAKAARARAAKRRHPGLL